MYFGEIALIHDVERQASVRCEVTKTYILIGLTKNYYIF